METDIMILNARRALFACVLLLAAFSRAQAASNILIWPIDPLLAPSASATELWIENTGSDPATMQVRIIGWQQIDGRENYIGQQQDVVASPPIVNIAGRKKQLIRLIRQISAPQGKELAYRILVDEIPPSAGAGQPATGVKLQMRYSIPLFVYGEGANVTPGSANPAPLDHGLLSWRLTHQDGHPALEIRNQGAVHARLSNVALNGRSLGDGLFGYVLANSVRVWPLAATPAPQANLRAQINNDSTPWQAAAQR